MQTTAGATLQPRADFYGATLDTNGSRVLRLFLVRAHAADELFNVHGVF